MRKAWGLVAMCVAGVGCSHVRVTQQDGCWVRDSWSFPNQVKQDVGPCSRPEPRWSEDRETRLLQECLAASEHRWHDEALAAWNKGIPFSAPASEEQARKACMNDAVSAVVHENDALKQRLTEAMGQRERLEATHQADIDYLRSTHTHMTSALGEAAKKPAPTAFATATSTGTGTGSGTGAAKSDSDAARPTPHAPAMVAPQASLPAPRPSISHGCPISAQKSAQKVAAEEAPPPPGGSK